MRCNLRRPRWGGYRGKEEGKSFKIRRIKAKKRLEKLKNISKKQMEELYKEHTDTSVDSIRAENMVNKLMDHVSPKFSVLPQPLDKTLIAVAPEDTADLIAGEWKNKFMTVYNHQILEKDELTADEEIAILQKQHEKYN